MNNDWLAGRIEFLPFICTKPLHVHNIRAKIIRVWGVASVFLSKSGLSPLFLHIESHTPTPVE